MQSFSDFLQFFAFLVLTVVSLTGLFVWGRWGLVGTLWLMANRKKIDFTVIQEISTLKEETVAEEKITSPN